MDHNMPPARSMASPAIAGLAVSASVYISPADFSATSMGEIMKAVAVPSLAMESCNPIARATFLPLNHLAMDLVTATPAISLPSPNSMHPI